MKLHRQWLAAGVAVLVIAVPWTARGHPIGSTDWTARTPGSAKALAGEHSDGLIEYVWTALPPGQTPDPVSPGETASYTTHVKLAGGNAFRVHLAVSGLPPGVTANFSPEMVLCDPLGTSALTLVTSTSTPIGDHSIEFRAEREGAPSEFATAYAVLSVRECGVRVRAVFATGGTGPGASHGFPVAAAGDVNGDGQPDLIVGENHDGDASDPGRAYVHFGGTGSDGVPDLILTGETPGDWFGSSVAGAGDVNGDGYDDLLISGHMNDADGENVGRAYIFLGGEHPDAVADLVLRGEAPVDLFGYSVSGAGDLNRDGYDDFMVGASLNDAGGWDAGRVYVYFGGPTLDTTPDLVLTGSWGSNFGRALAGVGDLSGDNYDDFVVGAHNAGGTGQAYVFNGGATPDAIADLTLSGESGGDRFGWSVSSAGDVNGDGHPDLIVGAFLNYAAGVEAGRAYLFHGGPDADAVTDLVLTAEHASDWFGISVAGAGDVDGDGYADLIVGSHGYDAGGLDAGRAFIFLGGPDADAIPDLTLDGELATGYFGASVTGLGDFDGDGFPDVMVGALGNDLAGTDAGRAYLFSLAPATGRVAGRVARDCPDPGAAIAGVRVEAYAGSPGGTLEASDVTGSDGAYDLNGLSSGTRWIRVVAPEGFAAVANDLPVEVQGCGTATLDFALRDAAAPVVSITAPSSGAVFSVGEPVLFSGAFADNVSRVAIATWMAGAAEFGGIVDTATGVVTGTNTFTTAGIYPVSLTVSDPCGNAATAASVDGLDATVVIINRGAGLATGAGWIESAASSYAPEPALTGRARFVFVARYARGATVPTGLTEFTLRAADLRFSSTRYDWLILTGPSAVYKGSGTVNGTGDYEFILSALDGDRQAGEIDRLRLKITDRATGAVLYDTQRGDPDDAAPTTALGGGAILVVSPSLGRTLPSATNDRVSSSALLSFALSGPRPNPARTSTEIAFNLPQPTWVDLVIVDVAGRKVATLIDGPLPAGRHVTVWALRSEVGPRVSPGMYFCRLTTHSAAGKERYEATRRITVME
jgi:hypothetical protein